MHLCLATDFFYPRVGGVETHVYNLARTAIRRGYRATIVTTVGGKRIIENLDGINVVRVQYPKISGFFWLYGLERRLYIVLKKLSPDIIHVHHAFSPMGLVASAVAKKLDIPVILTNHSIPLAYESFRLVWNYFSRIFLLYHEMRNIKKYDAVIAVSPLAAEYIRIYYPYEDKIFLIPPPVDDEFFSVESSKEEIGFGEEDSIVLFVGRPSAKKGIEFALYSFRIVARLEPRAKLCIVGPIEGGYKYVLRSLIRSWDIEDRVVFMGKVSREYLRKIYSAADIFIFPSYGGESFGLVVLESMATGTPVVTTRGGALGKYISRYRLGVVTGFNPKKFAGAILFLLRNEELRTAMGSRAKKFARIFSWNRLFDKIEEVYRMVMDK